MDETPTRRTFLTAVGSATAGAALFSTGTVASHSTKTVLSNAPIDPVSHRMYPTMGTDDDNPTLTLYGNFKCPYTQKFVLNDFADVVDEYVEPGRLNVRFRSLVYEPDPSNPSHGSSWYFISNSDPDIARSAYGVWNWEDENYWSYFYSLFADLPSGLVTPRELEDRMRDDGVRNWGKIRYEVANDKYQYYLERTRRAAAALGVSGTPTVELQGDLTSPNYGSLSDWIDRRL